MAYSTYADVLEEMPGEAVLIELTDDPDFPSGQVDESKVATAIARADGIIDGYLSQRLQTPVDPVPVAITAISVDLAIHALYTRKEALPEQRENRYKAAIAFLVRFARGDIGLGTLSAMDEDSPQWPRCYTPEQDFSEEIWAKY